MHRGSARQRQRASGTMVVIADSHSTRQRSTAPVVMDSLEQERSGVSAEPAGQAATQWPSISPYAPPRQLPAGAPAIAPTSERLERTRQINREAQARYRSRLKVRSAQVWPSVPGPALRGAGADLHAHDSVRKRQAYHGARLAACLRMELMENVSSGVRAWGRYGRTCMHAYACGTATLLGSGTTHCPR